MSLSSQARSLAARGSAARQDIFGVNADGETQMFRPDDVDLTPVPCRFHFVRDAQQLDEAKMRREHAVLLHIVRVLAPQNFAPRLGLTGKLVNTPPRGEDIPIRFDEFHPPGLSAEYVIGCASLG